MSMSRAKTLCSVVHEITQRVAEERVHIPLPLTMSVTGSNSTARYVRHARNGFYVAQQSKKNGTFEHVSSISLLDIGTLSKVSFDNAQLLMVRNIEHALTQKRTFLWLLHESVMRGEYFYRVLKSSTTQFDYDEMLRMYNAQAASSALTNPSLTRINKKGQPSRRIGQKYAQIPIRCEDFAAYPASYVTPSRPPMPARHCVQKPAHRRPMAHGGRLSVPRGHHGRYVNGKWTRMILGSSKEQSTKN